MTRLGGIQPLVPPNNLLKQGLVIMSVKLLNIVALGAICIAAVSAYAQKKNNTIEANKKVVYDFYRFVWEPRNVDAFSEYTSPSYIEHNPNFPGPRENIIRALKSGNLGNWSTPKKVEDSLKDPPDMIVAEGDIVQWIFKRHTKDPKDPTKTYESFWYDTFRIKDGKIVEHWDNALVR